MGVAKRMAAARVRTPINMRPKEGLSGKGYVTVSLLEFYISDRVRELTKEKQTPVGAKPSAVTDYQIALRR